MALDQLSNRAAVGGISFSTNANNGLMVTANGYTQRLPQLFRRCWKDILATTPQRNSWRRRNLVYADDGFCGEGKSLRTGDYASADDFAGALFFRDERRALLPSITLKEVMAYRNALKTGARPEFLVIGNMSEVGRPLWRKMFKNSSRRTDRRGVVTKTWWLRKSSP